MHISIAMLAYIVLLQCSTNNIAVLKFRGDSPGGSSREYKRSALPHAVTNASARPAARTRAN